MTNDLFRDLLEGRIPMAPKPKPPTLEETVQRFAESVGAAFNDVFSAFQKIADAFTGADLQSNYTLIPPAPHPQLDKRPRGGYALDWVVMDETDPRARALRAKQQQGHGPAMTPLRVRGRTTHYKEKG